MATELPATMAAQIETAKNYDISYRSLHVSAKIHDESSGSIIKIPYMSILSKYKYFMENSIVSVTFNDEHQRMYLYQPKRLSEDYYGTPEMWFEILRLNNCSSILEFKPVKVYLYDRNRLKMLINEILLLESHYNSGNDD